MQLTPTIRTLLIVLLLSQVTAAYAATVKNIRLWRSPESTRVVLDLDAPFKHKIFAIEKDAKLVIDIAQGRYTKSFDQSKLKSTPIVIVRYANHEDHLRIVFDLKSTLNYRSFTLQPNEKYGNRLVIDLFDNQQSPETTISVDQLVQSDRDIVIAIDAGHGGEDPGASGPNNIREKNIVLQISKELKKIIDKKKGYSALLIRTGDYYIPLEERYQKARSKSADLFISIHADAFENPQSSGASIYALSLKSATSASADYLAKSENRSDLIGGVTPVSLNDKDHQVAKILLDLAMASTLETSLKIGDVILRQIGGITKLHKVRVEQADFKVLKSPDVPSLLIETGFISNPAEAKKLKVHKYQKKLANRIFKGIDNYYQKNPPLGTLISKQISQAPRNYVVKNGDTLSDIALKFNTSIAEIRRYNKLKNNRIKTRQKLVIPN